MWVGQNASKNITLSSTPGRQAKDGLSILLIQNLLEVAWDLWEHCNGILHNKDNEVMQLQSYMID
jgi:hypothetical protein